MKRQVTNVAASVRQRLLNEAKRRGESFDYVASLFARERFLARLSLSPHRDRLTLKGATVFAVWLLVHRPTRDLDFLGSGDFEPASATAIIREIVSVAIEEDGLAFDAGSISAEAIREPDEYHGVRIRLEAVLDTAVDGGFLLGREQAGAVASVSLEERCGGAGCVHRSRRSCPRVPWSGSVDGSRWSDGRPAVARRRVGRAGVTQAHGVGDDREASGGPPRAAALVGAA